MKLQAPSLPPSPSPAPSAAPATGATPVAVHRPAATTAAAAGTRTQLRSTQADFDAERVAALRERIQGGSYQPRLDKVADGMLAHLRGLWEGRQA